MEFEIKDGIEGEIEGLGEDSLNNATPFYSPGACFLACLLSTSMPMQATVFLRMPRLMK